MSTGGRRIRVLVVAIAWGAASACAARGVDPSARDTPSSQVPADAPEHPAARAGDGAVSGRLRSPGNAPLRSVALIMSPLPGQGLTTVPSDDVAIAPDGSFGFRGVAAGRYQIRARAEIERDPTPLFASYNVIVRDGLVPGVELVLAPGANATGRVDTDGGRLPALAGARVSAPLAGEEASDAPPSAPIAADGSFSLRGLMPGRYAFRILNLPAPWVLERVIYRGQEVAAAGLPAESGQNLRDLTMIITRQPLTR